MSSQRSFLWHECHLQDWPQRPSRNPCLLFWFPEKTQLFAGLRSLSKRKGRMEATVFSGIIIIFFVEETVFHARLKEEGVSE